MTPELVSLSLIAAISFGLSYVGAAVGLVLGQLRVALLVYVLGDAVEGTATSLAVSTMATVVGAIAHARAGRVQLALLLTVGVPSALAAYFAARAAKLIDPRWLKLGIAFALLVTGIHMLTGFGRRRARIQAELAPMHRGLRLFCQVLVGAVLGAISGLVGLLLGTLRLPAMIGLARVGPAEAVGTNMAIGAVTGLSAGLSAFTEGHLNVAAFSVIAPLTLLGAHLGAQQTGKLDEAALTKWIGCALVPTSLIMCGEVALSLQRATS